MKHIPLFYYPTTLLWVDDDTNLLKIMSLEFNKNYSIKTFCTAKSCLDFLKNYKSALNKHQLLNLNEQDEYYGELNHTPINVDITKIARIANDKERYNDISITIIDYRLPDASGFDIAKNIHATPMKKILLTGKATPEETLDGFNKSLIDRMVRKGDPETMDILTNYINELTLDYFCQQTASLLASLNTEVMLPLNDPAFIQFFNNYVDRHCISEFYIIDKQGSFLCIDKNQKRFCLVMHTDNSLRTWLLNNKEGCPSIDSINAIKARQLIPFFGPGKEGRLGK